MAYLLRAGAVNLDNFVYDTNKIQPMRGGSFLLLNSVRKIVEKNKQGTIPTFNGIPLEKIATGASIGLYRFKDGPDVQPQKVADAVGNALQEATGGHATFVVDWLKETGDFKNDLKKLHAMNRWRQYQQTTLVLPNIDPKAEKECAYDGIRPACKDDDCLFMGEHLSSSVAFKTKKGRDLRHNIYANILGQADCDFTDDLQDLASHKDKGNLNDKVAFIYLDGNKFTEIRTTLCDSSDKLTAFSEAVENSRKKFLATLLDKANGDPDFKKDGKIRLETLLWGGDEMEIIVPAWRGWEVVKLFFDTMKDVVYDNVPLTHAGGIVFCKCKAPIRQIRRMARELADIVKGNITDDFKDIATIRSPVTHDKHDAFHFLVLESFDTIGGKVKHFAESFYGENIWTAKQMNVVEMDTLSATMETIKANGFPHNKIFDIIRAVGNGEAEEGVNQLCRNALTGNTNSEAIIASINKFIGGKVERWFIIAELWDYVGGEK